VSLERNHVNTFSGAIMQHVQAAFVSGIPFVCASGNEGEDQTNVVYPGRYGDITICVGATDRSGNKSLESCYGPNLDLCAPGVDIVTVNPGNPGYYYYTHGTSDSQPIVAGTIALIQLIRNDLHVEDYDGILKSTCYETGPYIGYDSEVDPILWTAWRLC
jgi:subtilisin family serine protease